MSDQSVHSDIDSYQEVLVRFADDLAAVERSIFENLESSSELLGAIGSYIASSGGKRLRPLLVILCSKLNGYEGKDHIVLGNVVEYLHAATLLHDDVLDDAPLRRGSPSANRRWGNHLAVLGGDFLYTSAFDLLLRRFPRDIIQILCRSSLDMIEGEVLQRQWNGRLDLTEGTYFRIIALKTASLISACCRTGALLGGASRDEALQLAEFGTGLGTAFQVIDDTLDYMAEREKLGKSLGGDLVQGTVTLPLIYLLREEGLVKEREELSEAVKRGGVEDALIDRIRGLLEERGSARKALEKAAGLARQSKEKLLPFEGSPLYPALTAAADYIIYRTH